MTQHGATIEWQRNGAVFTDNRYSRGHRWAFDGGTAVPASASPHVVPLPYSVAAAVDPEEALVASLCSCHMLWFLALAAKRGYVVDRYRDAAIGRMGRDGGGRTAMLEVILRPAVAFADGRAPDGAALAALHHEAHDACYIANSVNFPVRCDPAAPTVEGPAC